MFDEVLHASDPKAREKPFIALRQLLALHETAEEMIVHPRVRREFDGGDSIVDARLKEEHDAKEQLSKLENLDIHRSITDLLGLAAVPDDANPLPVQHRQVSVGLVIDLRHRHPLCTGAHRMHMRRLSGAACLTETGSS